MKKTVLLSCVMLLTLFSACDWQVPENMQDKVNVKFKELSKTAELSTVEYTVTKIVKADDHPEWYQFGDRKILFSCTATLKAGFDLNNFSSKDISVDETNKSAIVTLPKAKLLIFKMNPDDVHLIYEKVSLLRSDFSANDRNLLLQQGEADIKASIKEYGILDEAQKNASLIVKSWLTDLGFKEVTVKFV